MAAVVARLAQITEEHPYLSFGDLRGAGGKNGQECWRSLKRVAKVTVVTLEL